MVMDGHFDKFSEVVPGRDAWKFVVRVLRMWEVPMFLKPEQISSIEMVLLDQFGGRIHATIRKQLLYIFQDKLTEGGVYKLSNFTVLPNSGSYRTTHNKYKLMFQMRTKVQTFDSAVVPLHGFNFTDVSDVISHTKDYDYLVDVIGLLTGMSTEREYVKDGKVTRMVVIELTDHSGQVECALFGDYVDEIKNLVGKADDGCPIVVVQFAKVKIFRDKASLQNVMGTTKLYVNPDTPEIVKVKEGLVVHGIVPAASVPVMEQGGRASLEDDFLRLYPKATVGQLEHMEEDGTFIVFAVVSSVLVGEDWWYPACKCHRSVAPDSGAYYCKACVKHVFSIVPRFKVKVAVGDLHDDAVFVLFDNDVQYVLGTQCATLVADAKAENGDYYPPEFDNFKGKKLLFKVEISSQGSASYDGTFRVRRVCSDADIIDRFVCGVGGGVTEKVVAGDLVDKTEVVCLDDDSQGGGELLANDFVSGLIVSPVTKVLDDSIEVGGSSEHLKGDCGGAKRSLVKDFDEVARKGSKRRLKSVKIEKD